MFLPKLLAIFRISSDDRNNGNIYTVEEFQKLLQRERARADRTVIQFSLVTFQIKREDQDDHGALSEILVDSITRRVRLTDVAGWVNSKCIGLLLYNTCGKGAWKIAEEIRGNIPERMPSPECRVYTYPSSPASRGDEDSQGHSPSRGRSTTPAFPDRSMENRDTNCTEPALALQPLLGCRLPRWKRICDLGGALAGLVVLSVFFVVIGIAIKIMSSGPVFFKQQRVGLWGKPFTFWKFRTMKVNADTSGHKDHVCDLIKNGQPMSKLDDDPQIIPLGKFMRKTCIDELPQLINVLRGEMSLVGPRPCLPYEYEEYLQWHKKRFDILPGMTGLWQVNGKNKVSDHRVTKRGRVTMPV